MKPHLSTRCYHLAGTGGAKGAVRAVADGVHNNTFVFRTDVKSYHASIDPSILLKMLERYIKDPQGLRLLWDFTYRTFYDGWDYENTVIGICGGCPLSPLMGTLYI